MVWDLIITKLCLARTSISKYSFMGAAEVVGHTWLAVCFGGLSFIALRYDFFIYVVPVGF